MAMFRDRSWSSERSNINLNDYLPNKRHFLPNRQVDVLSWIVYNFPIGTVMTMTDDDEFGGEKAANIKDCGTVFDVVGTGKTEAIELAPNNAEDLMALFFWRTVDLNMGAIELFADNDFWGRHHTIFLSEWAPGIVHSLRGWTMNNDIGSIRWKTLSDRQTVTLYDGEDGSGSSYSNIKGWGSFKELAKMSDVRFDDRVSSFRWDSIVPAKEIIEPFIIMASPTSNALGLTLRIDGINNSTEVQPVVVTLTNETSQTVTVESSDQHLLRNS
jgi:hypothetical protein